MRHFANRHLRRHGVDSDDFIRFSPQHAQVHRLRYFTAASQHYLVNDGVIFSLVARTLSACLVFKLGIECYRTQGGAYTALVSRHLPLLHR